MGTVRGKKIVLGPSEVAKRVRNGSQSRKRVGKVGAWKRLSSSRKGYSCERSSRQEGRIEAYHLLGRRGGTVRWSKTERTSEKGNRSMHLSLPRR